MKLMELLTEDLLKKTEKLLKKFIKDNDYASFEKYEFINFLDYWKTNDKQAQTTLNKFEKVGILKSIHSRNDLKYKVIKKI